MTKMYFTVERIDLHDSSIPKRAKCFEILNNVQKAKSQKLFDFIFHLWSNLNQRMKNFETNLTQKGINWQIWCLHLKQRNLFSLIFLLFTSYFLPFQFIWELFWAKIITQKNNRGNEIWCRRQNVSVEILDHGAI